MMRINKNEKIINTLRELKNEYNLLTNWGNKININDIYGIENIEIYLSHNNEKGKVINKLNFFIKREIKKEMNINILQKKLPYELCIKIMEEYFSEQDCLAFEIDIEYDLLNYPSKPPLWKLKYISNNGFNEETEKEVKKLVNLHNFYLIEWNSYISLTNDLNSFMIDFIKIKK